MADLNTNSEVLSQIELDNSWTSFNMGDYRGGYLIATKSDSDDNGTIDVHTVTSIKVEIGVESGLGNTMPLIIKSVTLDFGIGCGDPSYDSRLAAAVLHDIPVAAYIRVKSITTNHKDTIIAKKSSTETCDIAISITKLDF